jgi:hypothetical protein
MEMTKRATQSHLMEDSRMSTINGVMKQISKFGLVLMMGVSMSAFSATKSWKEEVQLHDGRVLVVERFFNLGDYPTVDSRERSLLDETITFSLPNSTKRKIEFRNDLPEPNSLGPLLLDIVGGVPYIATSPAGCIAYNKWGRPNPPYVLFKFVNDEWKKIPLKEFPPELVHANLMSTPDSGMLKSYYTVKQVKEQMQGRNINAAAVTVLRESLPENQLCPDWSSPRYRSSKAPLPMKPLPEASK